MKEKTDNYNTVVVIPSIREQSLHQWFSLWESELSLATIIVVEDNPEKTFRIPKKENILHYSWKEIDEELGKDSWIIPRLSDCIRSFGFLKAYQRKPDMIITMDDDCYPDDKSFIDQHRQSLRIPYSSTWIQHFQGMNVRGFPYNLEKKQCILNMGLWSNIPDLDAKTQLQYPTYRAKKERFTFPVAKNCYAPISGMNVAFRPEVVPAYYFLLMGKNYEYDRFGDIWAGIFLKKICDHLDYIISGGIPYVRHDRASNPLINFKKEKPGLPINERLWKDIDLITIEGDDFKTSYLSLANQLPLYNDYFKTLQKAMKIWASLF